MSDTIGTDDAVDLLPCGRDPLDVVDRARAGHATPHELACPHCRHALDEAGHTAAAADHLTAEVDSLTVPETLVPTVMRGVRSALRWQREFPLDIAGMNVTVTDRVVAAVLVRALDTLPGLTVHTCRLRPTDDVASVPLELAVRVSAAGTYGVALLDVSDYARMIIEQTLHVQFGFAAGPVDIEIIDVIDPR